MKRNQRDGKVRNRIVLQIVCCLLIVSFVNARGSIPEGRFRDAAESVLRYGSTDHTLSEATAAIAAASARLRAAPAVAMTWPCNEHLSLAVESDSTSKTYSFSSEREEMQVFSSAGGTVTEIKDGRIVISHGNGLETSYEACTDIYVQPLQKVRKGELIASIRGGDVRPQLNFQILKDQQSVDIGDYLYEN